MIRYKLALTLIATSFAISCSKSRAPLFQAPPLEHTEITTAAGQAIIIAEPKVNILFVIDNSGSMGPHQEKLRRNIDAFANKFFDNPRVDYKIGVVPIYDRIYEEGEIKDENGNYVCRLKNGKPQARKMNPYAELVPLKDPTTGEPIEGPRYITRDTPNAKEILKKTVVLGTQCGPEAEEIFSPVLGVLDEKINSKVNSNFYEEDAYLVVIFVTDADDATPAVTADQFYEALVEAKGGDRRKVQIAMAIPKVRQSSSSCPLDGMGPIYKVADLVRNSGAFEADLCSDNFGSKLAEFGQKLVERVASQTITLSFVPAVYSTNTDSNSTQEAQSIKLFYGTRGMPLDQLQEIKSGKGGFTYNPSTNEIYLDAQLNITRVPDGELFLSATPAQLSNEKYGLVKRLGQ